MTPVEIRHFPPACAGHSRPRFAFRDDVRWLPVPGFPGYEVSNSGQIRSMLAAGFGQKPITPRTLRACDDGNGYRRVYLRRDGRTHSLKVSWLVLEAFEGPRPAGLDACHSDGFRDNDVVGNLRWDTRRGNLADCVAHGTATRGERVGTSKLTDQQVAAIRTALANKTPQRDVAASFGVQQSTVSKIKRGERWGWLV